MSKLNQIQAKLRELDGGTFQKLCDAYLYRKGYERINPLGSVIGANKVRPGTPDSLMALPNGKYVLAEYTTERDRVFDKLKGDVDKCLDPQKTGIPLRKVEEILLCHTSLLDTAEERELIQVCKAKRISLRFFGIGPISFDLYQRYPGLARDFLGIEVDTGQVLSPQDFVVEYGKNSLATPLDTSFRFRTRELEELLARMGDSEVVVIAGRPGVGKSRLGLEACRRFIEANPDYRVHCILNRGLDLYQDLRDHCSDDGRHLVFVDDANRVSRFDYALQLLRLRGATRSVKIVATVRDYALPKILEDARPFGGAAEVFLETLPDEELKTLIQKEFGILNSRYLDRIAEISRGNPRLAIMAARIATREGTLASLSNVSSLYDEYYKSVRADVSDLSNRGLLKVAGILAFFRVVDLTNAEFVMSLCESFCLGTEELRAGIERLHELEAVDLYEGEVAKISDQVLSTYLFYLAAFDIRALDFSILLGQYFPKFAHQMVDALNPLLSVFDGRGIAEKLSPHVDAAWRSRLVANDDEGLLPLMHHFWFVKETETLVQVRRMIRSMDPELTRANFTATKSDANIPSPSLLSVLASFSDSTPDRIDVALSLLCELLAKRPDEYSRILHLLTTSFGFRHTSWSDGYRVQLAVANVLWARCREGDDEIHSSLFVAVATVFLKTHFHWSQSARAGVVNVYNFDLEACPALLELRSLLWQRLFKLYRSPRHSDAVLGVLAGYSPIGRYGSVREIAVSDAEPVLAFIDRELDPASFRHCRLAQSLIRTLEWHEVDIGSARRERFNDAAYSMYELLLEDRRIAFRKRMSYEEFESEKARRLEEHFMSFGAADYEAFLSLCEVIQPGLDGMEGFRLSYAVMRVLLRLAERDVELFANVMRKYLRGGNRLAIRDLPALQLASTLVDALGAAEAREMLFDGDYESCRSWHFGYFGALRPYEIGPDHVEALYEAIARAEVGDLPTSADFLEKYRGQEPDIVSGVLRILVRRATQDPRIGHVLASMFRVDPGTKFLLHSVIPVDAGLFEEAYFMALSADPGADYAWVTMNALLDHDPGFLVRYLHFTGGDIARFSTYSGNAEFSALWLRSDYEEIFESAIDHLFERGTRGYRDKYRLQELFVRRDDEQTEASIAERQDAFITRLISERAHDADFMPFLFSAIASFPPVRRRCHTASFLNANQSIEAFERLPLEPSHWSWSGSLVPVLQGRIDYLDSLISLLAGPDLLLHRHLVEQKIAYLRDQVEREKRSDFMGPYS